jgi:hypothetical protein
MKELANINLITVLQVYLIITLIVSIVKRYRQYRAILGFVFALPNRYPRLLQLAKQHRGVFLTWPTMLPVVVSLLLLVANTLAHNLVWTQARVTPADLWQFWYCLIAVAATAAAMLYLDLTAISQVAPFDREGLEKNLDQAEYWLGSWVAPTLRVLTFGFVNPRKIVGEEVRKSLAQASMALNKMMWRWALQTGARMAFGLSIWITWFYLVRRMVETPPEVAIFLLGI